MFDLTCRQAEEEWNKTGVWVLKTPVNKKKICVEGLTQCSMNVYTDISGISESAERRTAL